MITSMKQILSGFLMTAILLGLTPFINLAQAEYFLVTEDDYTYYELYDFEVGTVTYNGYLEASGDNAVSFYGSEVVLNNYGYINGDSNRAVYVYDTSGDGVINNYDEGEIYSWDRAAIMNDGGYNLTINNYYDAYIYGYDNQAIKDEGTYTTINNWSEIYSEGYYDDSSEAIKLKGAYATVNNYGGYIYAEDAPAITTQGYGTTINNFISEDGNWGEIYSEDYEAIKVRLAENVTINNDAYIYSYYGDGIFVQQTDYLTINNSEGAYIEGGYWEEDYGSGIMVNNSEEITINNDGYIWGYVDYGIALNDVDYTQINNSGEIWGYEHGIELDYSEYTYIDNSGEIYGYESGIDGYASGAVIIDNSGGIYGYDSAAIDFYSSYYSININNTGEIESEYESGIDINDASSVYIENDGLISGDYYAIEINNADYAYIDLLGNSVIDGVIDVYTNNYGAVNIYDHKKSTVLEINGADEINFYNTVGVVNGNKVQTIDITGDSNSAANMASTTSAIHGVLNSRMSHSAPMKLASVVATELTPGSLYREKPAQAWGELFTLKRTKDDTDQTLNYEQKVKGFTGGYEYDNNNHRAGYLLGFSSSSAETDEVKSVDTDTDTVFVGVYGQYYSGDLSFTASLIGGLEQHENRRHVFDVVEGNEVAKADYDSLFISPSIKISLVDKLTDRLELRPSIAVAYTLANLDGYKETGTTNANLTVGEQSMSAVNTTIELALAHVTNSSEIELRGGIKSRSTNSDEIDASIAGANFKYSALSDTNVSGEFFGVYARYNVGDSVNMTADWEVTNFDKGEKEALAKIGLEMNF